MKLSAFFIVGKDEDHDSRPPQDEDEETAVSDTQL